MTSLVDNVSSNPVIALAVLTMGLGGEIPSQTNCQTVDGLISASSYEYLSSFYSVELDERQKNLPKGALPINSNKPLAFIQSTAPNIELSRTNNPEKPFKNSGIFNLNIAGFDFPNYYYDNLSNYWNDLDIQLFKYGSKFKLSSEHIRQVGLYTASKIAALDAEDSILELSPDYTLKFTLMFPGEKMLMINKPLFPSENYGVNDIFFSFFIKKELVSSHTHDFDVFVADFKKYLNA